MIAAIAESTKKLQPEGEFIFSKQENFDTESTRTGAVVNCFVRKFSQDQRAEP
jgi:hypothetical protein